LCIIKSGFTATIIFFTLIGLKPGIVAVKAVGTDRERNLVDAVVCNFPEAAHIQCFQHLQQNIETHLHEHHFSSSVIT